MSIIRESPAEPKRRLAVPFDAVLRRLTEETTLAFADVFAAGVTPPPTPHRQRCRACSLYELCRPDAVRRAVKTWRAHMVSRLIAERPGP